MQTKPQSIREITEVVGERKKFRFRDFITMYDFFTPENIGEEFGHIMVLNLDNRVYSQLNTQIRQFVLLSSPEEIKYLNNLTYQGAINAARKNYVKQESR